MQNTNLKNNLMNSITQALFNCYSVLNHFMVQTFNKVKNKESSWIFQLHFTLNLP